jgi:drug/metabolite transporter (DMT)-like permease
MSALLALLAAAFYGAADFCGGLASKRSSAVAVVALSQAVGFMLLGAAIAFVPGTHGVTDLAWGALAGAAGAGAIVMLYRGLAIGTMGVVSPITAVLAALVPVVFAVGRGEWPSLVTTFGIALALGAVVCMSATPGTSMRSSRGIPEALGAGLAFGIFFIALAQADHGAGLWPLFAARAISVSLFIVFALFGGGLRSLVPARADWPLIALCGAMDMGSNVLYVLAVQRGTLAVAAVLTSLYPASTVILAAVVLHERLAPVQRAGVLLALAGIAAITAG